LEKIRKAGGKIVEGFGRNGHRHNSNQEKGGGYNPKNPQGPAKWVHADATGLTKKMWRSSVELIDTALNEMDTPSTMTATVSSTQDTATEEETAVTPFIMGALSSSVWLLTRNQATWSPNTQNLPSWVWCKFLYCWYF
jgi:hypothetical protein